MPIIEPGTVRESLSGYPIATYATGDCLLRQGTTTDRLLVLQDGAVDIVRDEATIARVDEPGAVFGDMAAILGLPHSADVWAAAPSRCRVIDNATMLLRAEPDLALYVMTVLASRLDAVNGHLIEARRKLGDTRVSRGLLADMLDDIGRAMRIGVPV